MRDLFLIGCFIGLRYSDFIQIQPENIIEEGGTKYLEMPTQKTSQRVVIPLKPLSNQKMNQYLKVIGKNAGLTNKIEIIRTKAGKRTRKLVPKHELIKTHICRKSFATNVFRQGLSTLSIMKITGHNTEQQFFRYVRITEQENASDLINHEFFKD